MDWMEWDRGEGFHISRRKLAWQYMMQLSTAVTKLLRIHARRRIECSQKQIKVFPGLFNPRAPTTARRPLSNLVQVEKNSPVRIASGCWI